MCPIFQNGQWANPATKWIGLMNILKQAEVASALTEGLGIRATARITGANRETVGKIILQVGRGCAELHDRTMVGGSKRFARLSNGFSKRLECHLAAVALHVAFYNLCRVHETPRSTPATALGIADRVWTIGADLPDAALTAEPPKPTTTAPDRRRQFRVIEGGKS
jgi:hypothetical protein